MIQNQGKGLAELRLGKGLCQLGRHCRNGYAVAIKESLDQRPSAHPLGCADITGNKSDIVVMDSEEPSKGFCDGLWIDITGQRVCEQHE